MDIKEAAAVDVEEEETHTHSKERPGAGKKVSHTKLQRYDSLDAEAATISHGHGNGSKVSSLHLLLKANSVSQAAF